ncbi:MAG: Peptide/nickel transport system permease protein [Acidimicrobiaceae bacterium]|jgi:peptide/nickel transport system permease protein|nr:Peptide/nickel transport system permease protein [Acidimicrobiaceae bacterium]
MAQLFLVGRRLVQLIPTLFGVTLVVFFMIHLIPGDPARTVLGLHATPRAVALLHKEWGLNRSLPSQYWLFLDRLVHGNLGQSLFYSTGTTGLIEGRLPATAWLLIYATLLVVVMSVPLAMLAATKKNGVRDHFVRVIPLFGLGMPSFWVGIILAEIFSIKLRLFPVDGFGSGFFGHLRYMFLPSFTVALAMAPVVIRSLRASMLDMLSMDFVVTARSKGVPGPRLFIRHVLRNAVLPTVTVLGLNVGFLIGSTVIIEQVFALPGIGSLMVNAIFNRDFPVVQGVTLVFGVLVVGVNLLTDVAYSALDPRVKISR